MRSTFEELTIEDLRMLQAKTTEDKAEQTLGLVSEWYAYWQNMCYVSFSGGIDSTVLADITAKWCAIAGIPLELVFVDTGLEYPEIKDHVRAFAQYLRERYDIEVNLTVLRPKMVFADVITKYGYPMLSKEVSECVYEGRRALERFGKSAFERAKLKRLTGDVKVPGSVHDLKKWQGLLDVDFMISHKCCSIMKKSPSNSHARETEKKQIVGTMAEESALRKEQWIRHGCNSFDAKSPKSAPMSFWLRQDVLAYIKTKNLPIATVYGDIIYAKDPEQIRMDESFCGERLCTTGCQRTGCIFCGFGAHLEKGEGRFVRLKRTHPKLWRYCIYGGGYDPADGLWKPTKEGLGMGHVFDVLNGLYGDGFIPYGKE